MVMAAISWLAILAGSSIDIIHCPLPGNLDLMKRTALEVWKNFVMSYTIVTSQTYAQVGVGFFKYIKINDKETVSYF